MESNTKDTVGWTRRAWMTATGAAAVGMWSTGRAVEPLPWPAAMTLKYEVSGRARGLPYRAASVLHWEPNGAAYTASLDMRAPLVGTRTQRSEGRLSRDGLRPERYIDQARRERRYELAWAEQRFRYLRDGQFMHDGPLVAGTQDRLSLFFQLGLWARSQAQEAMGSATAVVPVLGQGGTEPWRFRLAAQEAVDTPAGSLPALRLERERADPGDTQITLWLAPAVHHLPARLVLEDDEGHRVDQRLRRLP